MIEYPIAGVAAVILNPGKEVLTILETSSKQRTHKFKGMRSIPMESRELSDNFDDENTLDRMVNKEEVKGVELVESRLTNQKLCLMQMSPGVWVNFYLLHSKSSEMKNGEYSDVTDPKWYSMEVILSYPKYCFYKDEDARLPYFLDDSVKEAMRSVIRKLPIGESLSPGNLLWRPGTEDALRCYLNLLKEGSSFKPRVYKSTIDQLPSSVFDELAVAV